MVDITVTWPRVLLQRLTSQAAALRQSMSAPACSERQVLHLRLEACWCQSLMLRPAVHWLQFMDFAKLVCSKLMDRGSWADFVDPFSDTAVKPAACNPGCPDA